ncbi:helix-turn-helix transcriptional regulator [Kitasatospora sp. NPDC002551]|uniref:helix-turn-helix domain-containing protein n=1 Tax=Kitasatospora sp. NPDC002551 TaxID=3154539 RepID=UPI0033349A08
MITSGDDVYQRRTRLRLTQQQLAGEVGVSAGHVSQIENGLAHPNLQTAVLLEVALTEYERNIPRREPTILRIGNKLSELSDSHIYQLQVYLEHILRDHY